LEDEEGSGDNEERQPENHEQKAAGTHCDAVREARCARQQQRAAFQEKSLFAYAAHAHPCSGK
jgi:hypothetical protein